VGGGGGGGGTISAMKGKKGRKTNRLEKHTEDHNAGETGGEGRPLGTATEHEITQSEANQRVKTTEFSSVKKSTADKNKGWKLFDTLEGKKKNLLASAGPKEGKSKSLFC